MNNYDVFPGPKHQLTIDYNVAECRRLSAGFVYLLLCRSRLASVTRDYGEGGGEGGERDT